MEVLAHHRSMSRISELSAVLEVEEERPVRCAKFRRQELWAYKPVWSPLVVATMYSIMSLMLIPLGVVVLVQSSRLMNTPLLRYDRIEQCNATRRNQLQNVSVVPKCVLKINIPRRTRGRVYMYYALSNFYQNARRYAKSRSFEQLMGRNVSLQKLRASCRVCDTAACAANLYPNVNDRSKVFVPCGLTARSVFNDTFKLCRDEACNDPVKVTGKNIAWAIDRNEHFLNNSANTPEQNANITSEDFMVWMRLAPYRVWHKLYRKILEPLENTTYYMHVESNYPVQSFNGQKYIYLTETTWFGGPNQFLGIGCIVVGGLSLFLALTYGVRSKFVPEPDLPPQTEVPWKDVAHDESGDRQGNSLPMK